MPHCKKMKKIAKKKRPPFVSPKKSSELKAEERIKEATADVERKIRGLKEILIDHEKHLTELQDQADALRIETHSIQDAIASLEGEIESLENLHQILVPTKED